MEKVGQIRRLDSLESGREDDQNPKLTPCAKLRAGPIGWLEKGRGDDQKPKLAPCTKLIKLGASRGRDAERDS